MAETTELKSSFVGVPKSRALIVIPQPPSRFVVVLRRLAGSVANAVVWPVVALAAVARLLLRGVGSAGRVLRAVPRFAARQIVQGARALQPALIGAWVTMLLGIRTAGATLAAFVRGTLMTCLAITALVGLGLLHLAVLTGRGSRALAVLTARGSRVLAVLAARGLRSLAVLVGRMLVVFARHLRLGAIATGRGLRVALAWTGRILFPTGAEPTVVVAGAAYVALVAINMLTATIAHPVVHLATALAWLLAAGYVVAAVRGRAPKAPGLFALTGMTIGSAWLLVCATLTVGLTWLIPVALAVTILTLRASLHCAPGLAVQPVGRSEHERRCHRDIGYGLAGVLLAQTAVVAVSRPGVDLVFLQLGVAAFGTWLAHAASRGRCLGLAHWLLFAGAAIALVLGAAESFRAFGEGHAFSAASVAYLALLACIGVALVLVLRVRLERPVDSSPHTVA